MQIARQQQLAWPLRSCQQASLQQPTGAIDAIPAALSAQALGQMLLGLGNSAVRLRVVPISGSSGRSQGQGSATAEAAVRRRGDGPANAETHPGHRLPWQGLAPMASGMGAATSTT